MAGIISNSIQNESQDKINPNSNDSSYHLKVLSFEDSQVDNFVAYASPSILNFQCHKYSEQDLKTTRSFNLSDIERQRGIQTNPELSTSNLIQIPAENTINSTQNSSQTNNKSLKEKKSFENINHDRLSIQSQHSKWNELSSNSNNKHDLSIRSNNKIILSDFSYNSAEFFIRDLSPKISKKLEFLDSTLQKTLESFSSTNNLSSSFPSNTTINQSKENVSHHIINKDESLASKSPSLSNKPKKQNIDNIEDDINNKENEMSIKDENELLELIDQKLQQKINKKRNKQMLMQSGSASSILSTSKYDNLKKTNSSLTWEISPNNFPSVSQSNKANNKREINKTDKTNHSITDISDVSLSLTESNINKNNDHENDQNNEESDISDLVNKFYINVKNDKFQSQKSNLKSSEIKKNFPLEPFDSSSIIVKSNLINKENKINEVSTQTSFIAEIKNLKDNSFKKDQSSHEEINVKCDKISTSDIEMHKKLRKEKIQKIILLEKMQHEKRVRELEKLAQLEKLHAQNLRNIMLSNSQNDSLTSLLDDSYFKNSSHLISQNSEHDLIDFKSDEIFKVKEENKRQKERKLSLNQFDLKPLSLKNINQESNQRRASEMARTDFNEYKLKNFQEIQNLSIIPDETAGPISEKAPSKVEVFNLKDTTVLAQPEHVFVIKEMENTQSSNKNRHLLSKGKLKQTNDIHTDEDGRLFFTLTSGHNESKSTIKSTNQQKSMINGQQSQIANNHFKIGLHSASQPSIKTYGHQQLQQNRHSNNEKRELNAFKQMSLQEAFEINNRDLIARSRKRLKDMKERAQKRHEQAQLEQQNLELNRQVIKKSTFSNKSGYLSHHTHFESNQNSCGVISINCNRPRMSSQEIKKITKKNYEKLPEFKVKKDKQRNDMDKKLNRFKSSIYKRTIQQHVLSKGPNFNMNFKALQNL